jgi:hypothetical protein
MPEIGRFGSFKLLMFFQDENPPHVHVKGADFARENSHLERRPAGRRCAEQGLERARHWVERHKAELLALWREFQR